MDEDGSEFIIYLIREQASLTIYSKLKYSQLTHPPHSAHRESTLQLKGKPCRSQSHTAGLLSRSINQTFCLELTMYRARAIQFMNIFRLGKQINKW